MRYYDREGVAPFRRRVPVEVRGRAHYRDVIVPELSGRHVVQGDVTFTEHVDRYLAAHATGRDASTVKTLKHRLGYATASGDRTLEEFERRVPEIAA
jgi:hypothetical protein